MNFEVVLHKSEQGFGIGVEAQPIEGRGSACFVITCDLGSEAAQQQLEVGDEVISYIIRNARIENVGKYQSCMISKLRIICRLFPLPGWQ